jgi:hypothetical protein
MGETIARWLIAVIVIASILSIIIDGSTAVIEAFEME